MEKKKGILLFALGSPHYGKMAANLAMSIKYGCPDMKIHVCYSGQALSSLTEQHMKLFDSTSECPETYYVRKGKTNYFKAKLYINELSPFHETLVIDVDTVLFAGKPVSLLFDEMRNKHGIALQVRGWHDYRTGKTHGNYTHWFDVAKAKTAYDMSETVYQLSSELIWFKKVRAAAIVLETAQKIFDEPQLPVADFAGDIPDEFAFNIATSSYAVKMACERPLIYWYLMDKYSAWAEVVKDYYGISVGGNNLSTYIHDRYDKICAAYARAMKLPYHYRIYAKKQWNEKRKLI
jgi:hypothetical protein